MSDCIYEITKKMNNDFQNDLNQITTLVNDYFKKKYLDEIQHNVTDYRTKLSTNPPREIQLLNALKAFTAEEKKPKIDNVINAVTAFNTFNSIANDFYKKKSAEEMKICANKTDSSVKPDGVYDIDESCSNKTNTAQMSVKDLLFVLFAAGAL